MPMPVVAPQDVADYAEGSPAVSVSRLLQATDWAEGLFRRANVEPPSDSNTLEYRELVRGICAYALSRLPGAQVLAVASAADRVLRLKDSDGSEIQFAEQTVTDLATAGADLLAVAYRHLHLAGLPRALFRPGVSR